MKFSLILLLLFPFLSSVSQVMGDTLTCSCTDLKYNRHTSFLSDSTIPFTGKCLRYTDRGTISSSYSYINGKRCGTSYRWYSSGKLKAQEMYYPNREKIDYKVWYENGNMKKMGINQSADYPEELFFDRVFGGIQIPLQYGGETDWYENGNLQKIRWNDTTRHIHFGKDWDEKGNLKEEEETQEISRDNRRTKYYPNGKIESISYSSDGQEGVWTTWYENGHKSSQTRFVYGSHNQEKRTEKFWTSEGKFCGLKKWRNGKLIKDTLYDYEHKPGQYP